MPIRKPIWKVRWSGLRSRSISWLRATLFTRTPRDRTVHPGNLLPTRRVPYDVAWATLTKSCAPIVEDLALARVDAIGHHTKFQLASGCRKHMFVGNEIVVAYGNRYTASQFEALIPETMGPLSSCVQWRHRVTGDLMARPDRQGARPILQIGLLVDSCSVPGAFQLLGHVAWRCSSCAPALSCVTKKRAITHAWPATPPGSMDRKFNTPFQPTLG